MNFIPVLFFAIIGGAMYQTMGHNSDSSGPYTVIFYGALAVMMSRRTLAPIRERARELLMELICIGSLAALIRNPLIIYADPHSKWNGSLEALIWGALALSIVGLVAILVNARRALKWAALSAILLLFVAQVLVPLISPHPWIDVFVNNTKAVDHFLRGANPYTQVYPDIYNGRYDYKPGFLYFPGLLYWLAPFRAVFGDIRFGYIFANILIALGLHGLARKLKAPEAIQWLAPLLWVSFPVTFFVLEQSWIDTVLIALAVLTFWSLEEDKWILTGVFMGAAFSVKQYGFLIGLIACIELWRRLGIRTAVKAAGVAAGVAAVVILPFAIADWQHFYASTITAQTSSAVRLDAYNATTFIALTFHWILPAAVRMALSALGIAVAAVYVARKKEPGLAEAGTALFLGYGTAFLFGKFAFCNYHYLLAGMLLLYLVGSGELANIGDLQSPQRARRYFNATLRTPSP